MHTCCQTAKPGTALFAIDQLSAEECHDEGSTSGSNNRIRPIISSGFRIYSRPGRGMFVRFSERGDVDSGIQLGSPLAPALVAPRPPATPQTASGPAPSPTPAPEVFQRWVSHLNLVLGALFFMVLMLICQCSSICRPDLPLPLPPACKPRRHSQRV